MIEGPGVVWGLLALCFCAAAFLSACETALFSLDLVERRRAGPRVQRLLEEPEALWVTLLQAGLCAEIGFFALAAGLAQGSGLRQALALGLGALLFLVVLGEVVPKAVALRAPVAIARPCAPAIALLVVLAGPVRRALQALLAAALRGFGELARPEGGITSEALARVLEQSAERERIELSEADLLAEVIELDGIRVREIMTPRVDMLVLDLARDEDDNLQVLARALARRSTWLPVVRGNPDLVAGCVRVRAVLAAPEAALADLVEPVRFVPEVASVLDLLRVMREGQATEAVVVDEYGGTAGTVTIEEIFEEIVGDLRVEGETTPPPVEAQGGGRFRVAGSLSIRDWNEQFGRQVVPAGFETVGGFVAARLGRIPRAGDLVRQGGLVTRVHEVRGRRVHTVEMYLEDAPGSPSNGGPGAGPDAEAHGSR